LRAKYPRLIHCSITGYGFTGPKAGRPGYDILAQAEAGLMSFTGEPDGGPMRYPIAIADMTCGLYSAMGILSALFAREKTGEGQFLDMALFDSQLTWLSNVGSSYLNANTEPRRWGNAHPNIVPYQVFRAKDGTYFVVAIGTERLWKKLMDVLQSEQTIGADARFVSNPLRIEHRSELIAILQQRFDKEPRDSWLERFADASIPAAPINTVPEALRDAQALARGLIVQIEHPALGEVRGIANPVRFSDTPATYRLPPPMLGEHTKEILQEFGAKT
jgi:crotonobetainyl-CoA:carnitine CoA-transferase CaiB-like acyl-CoA transferase